MSIPKKDTVPKRPAIVFRTMHSDDAEQIRQIDRSEFIEQTCRIADGQEIWTWTGHECPAWDEKQLAEIQLRFRIELDNGGIAIGAYDHDRLAGFGLLGSRPIGSEHDRLPIELMYVGRPYRRRGIGTRLMGLLGREASARGAASLYISSTESASAIGFYRSVGSERATEPDSELLAKEPLDIHLIRPL